MKWSLYFSLICLLFVSCNPVSHQKLPDQEQMEILLEDNPDGLAVLLEEVIDPLKLSEADKADYAFWLANTHVRQHRSLINDTLIHYAVNIYREMQSSRLTEACVLAFNHLRWAGAEPAQQELLLKEALSFCPLEIRSSVYNMA